MAASAVAVKENGVVEPKSDLPSTKLTRRDTPDSTPSKKQQLVTSPLVGKELLQEVRNNIDLPTNSLAKLCGYWKASSKGKIYVQLVDFYNAVLAAKGISLGEEPSKKRGRKVDYEVALQKNGSILLGAAYTKEMQLEPKARFDVKIGRKKIQLTLIGADEADDE